MNTEVAYILLQHERKVIDILPYSLFFNKDIGTQLDNYQRVLGLPDNSISWSYTKSWVIKNGYV